MPIQPDEAFHNTQNPTDSVLSAKERRDRWRVEAQEKKLQEEAAEKQQKAKKRDAKEDAEEQKRRVDYINKVSTGETREHLLSEIPNMTREQLQRAILRLPEPDEPEPAPEPKPAPQPTPLTPRMQELLNAEQECGRQAVAKAEAEKEFNRAAAAKAAQEQAAREHVMVPVVHPNPTQNERFPVNKSTIDKPR